MSKTILITGAAGGIGEALVTRARVAGHRVFAAARRLDQLEAYAQSSTVTPVAMDVGDTASVASAFAAIDEALAGAPLDAVIHSAAIAPFGTVEYTDSETFASILNINAVGSYRILRESLPRLRGHDGRLILISSLWSRTGGPLLSGYAASKHAIGGMADAARRETSDQGVHISIIELGVVVTKMLTGQQASFDARAASLSDAEKAQYGRLYAKYLDLVRKTEKTALSAEDAARLIEKPLYARKPKARYRVGVDAKAISLMSKILPDSVFDSLIGMAYK